tara:strand:+ start:524 stop:1135 length:612 start_codon:yes stop_codon:yes gene_type:complete
VIFVCPKCLKAVSVVMTDPKDIPFMEQIQAARFGCLKCGEPVFYHPSVQKAVSEDPRRYRVEQLSAEQLFQAMHGFGTPTEKEQARPEVVEDLLEESKIVGFSLEGSGDRAVLTWIAVKTQEGVLARLHLAASQQRAVVYKVEIHDEQAVRGTDGDPDPNRTQAGPGHPHVDSGSDGGQSPDPAGGAPGGEPDVVVSAVRTGT